MQLVASSTENIHAYLRFYDIYFSDRAVHECYASHHTTVRRGWEILYYIIIPSHTLSEFHLIPLFFFFVLDLSV